MTIVEDVLKMLVIFIYRRDILKFYNVGLNLVRIEFPKVHIQYFKFPKV